MGDNGREKSSRKYAGLKCIVYIVGAVWGFFYFKSVTPFVSVLLGIMIAGLIFQMLEQLYKELTVLFEDPKPPR